MYVWIQGRTLCLKDNIKAVEYIMLVVKILCPRSSIFHWRWTVLNFIRSQFFHVQVQIEDQGDVSEDDVYDMEAMRIAEEKEANLQEAERIAFLSSQVEAALSLQQRCQEQVSLED